MTNEFTFSLIAFIFIMVGLLAISVAWYIMQRRTDRLFSRFVKDQRAIMEFMLKEYEERTKAEIKVRLAEPTGTLHQVESVNKAEIYKEVGALLRDAKTGDFIKILDSLDNGALPAKDQAPAPDPPAKVETPPPATVAAAAAPDPDTGKKKRNPSQKALDALKAINTKRHEEKLARQNNNAPAPGQAVQAADQGVN